MDRPSLGAFTMTPFRQGLLLVIMPLLVVLPPIFFRTVVGDDLMLVDGRHSRLRNGGEGDGEDGGGEEGSGDELPGGPWNEYLRFLMYLGFHGVAVAGPDDGYNSQNDGKFNIEEFQLMAILDDFEDGKIGPKTCLRIGLKCYQRVGQPEFRGGYMTYMRAKSGDGDTLHIFETNKTLFCGVHDTEQNEAKMKGILVSLADKLLKHGF